jgi:hypothetical protein
MNKSIKVDHPIITTDILSEYRKMETPGMGKR